MSVATVIGAGGFIGNRLVKVLRDEGREVYAPDRTDMALFDRDLGHVFYCAGLAGDVVDRSLDVVEAHAGLIARILREARFERLIYLSSTRLYDGLGPDGGREDAVLALDPTLPRTVYDLSKALGETLCLTQSGGRAAVARLSNVFDLNPLASGFLSELLAQAVHKRSITLETSPADGRDYIHLDDAIAGLLALDSTTGSAIVNIASGDILVNSELARTFRSAGWRLGFTGRTDPPLPPACDIARLARLGVRPRNVRDVLSRMLNIPGYFRG